MYKWVTCPSDFWAYTGCTGLRLIKEPADVHVNTAEVGKQSLSRRSRLALLIMAKFA